MKLFCWLLHLVIPSLLSGLLISPRGLLQQSRARLLGVASTVSAKATGSFDRLSDKIIETFALNESWEVTRAKLYDALVNFQPSQEEVNQVLTLRLFHLLKRLKLLS